MNAWMEQAACRATPEDAEIFFPAGERAVDAVAAKAICATCPVLEVCREWAIAALSHGIAGGMTEEERRAQRRAQGVPLQQGLSRVHHRRAAGANR